MLCIGYNELMVAGYDHHHLLPQKRHFAPILLWSSYWWHASVQGSKACMHAHGRMA